MVVVVALIVEKQIVREPYLAAFDNRDNAERFCAWLASNEDRIWREFEEHLEDVETERAAVERGKERDNDRQARDEYAEFHGGCPF